MAALPHLVLLAHAVGGHRWVGAWGVGGEQVHSSLLAQTRLASLPPLPAHSARSPSCHPPGLFPALASRPGPAVLALWSLANYMQNVWHFFRQGVGWGAREAAAALHPLHHLLWGFTVQGWGTACCCGPAVSAPGLLQNTAPDC